MRTLFTSESVTEGHPDKICDQISDAVLDALLEQDPDSRVACETCATTGLVMVMGEITTKGYVPIADIVRKVVTEIGYDRAKKGFDGQSCAVLTAVHDQSPDIAQGVDDALETRNGAENETGAGARGAPPPPQDPSPLRGTPGSSLRSPAEGEGHEGFPPIRSTRSRRK